MNHPAEGKTTTLDRPYTLVRDGTPEATQARKEGRFLYAYLCREDAEAERDLRPGEERTVHVDTCSGINVYAVRF